MASQSPLGQSTASVDNVERYEVIDGMRVEWEPMGAFETVLASWLCFLINSFAVDKKLGLAVNEVLFILCISRPQASSRRSLCILCTLAYSRCAAHTCLGCSARFGGRNRKPRQSCRGNRQ
jgi:hypothetical protein